MAEIKLTPEQEQAICGRGGATLVSAAAGSGKTFVLVERLLRRLTDPQEPCDIDEFLIITFTKKAAGELRTRITKQLAARLAQDPGDRRLARQLNRMGLAQITTIDGFCSELVRRYAFRLDLSPDFRQIEEQEADQLAGQVVAAVLERRYAGIAGDPDFRHLSDTVGAGEEDAALDEAVKELYDASQCHADPELWLRGCLEQLELPEGTELAQTPWGSQMLLSFRRSCRTLIRTLRGGIRLSAQEEPLVGFGVVLESDIAQLEGLCGEERWEALAGFHPVYMQAPTVKAQDKTPLFTQISKLRENVKRKLKERLAAFGDPARIRAEQAQNARALRALLQLTLEFSEAFAREKRRLRVQDFSDVEHAAVKLLLRPDGSRTPLAKELSEQYVEVMLDEYQDTNEVQDKLFRALSRDGKNRFMVGDVKQSIYRFRLADPGIFLDKYKRYAPYEQALPGQPRKILLSENFRSDRAILEAVNAVFGVCMSEQVGELRYGEEERLRHGAKDRREIPPGAVELHCVDTKPEGSAGHAPPRAEAEADFVARRIRALLDEKAPVADGDGLRPVRAGDVVILMRSQTGASLFLQALQRQGIDAVCTSRSDLLSAPQIETFVSLLQVLDNAHQDVPLAAVLLSPVFALPAASLARLRAQCPEGDLWDALSASDLPEAAAARDTILSLRERLPEAELPALLTLAAQATDFEALCLASPDGRQRLEELRQFFALAEGFSGGGERSLAQFLDYLRELKEKQTRPEPAAVQKDAVNLMSIHASKGLEFPVVVLAGLSGRFNDTDEQKRIVSHPKLGVACDVTDPVGRYRYRSFTKNAIAARLRMENRAEELRVLYVAMTRAKDRLIMSYCCAGLDARLRRLAAKLTLPPDPIVAADAACPGDWVLEAALLRAEANELFDAGGKPEETESSALRWVIRYHVFTQPEQGGQTLPAAERTQRERQAEAIRRAPDFRYPGAAAQTPSKLTATQLKGRRLDTEIAEGAPERSPSARQFRRPSFAREKPLSPAERGTAAHLAMQYIDFARTGSTEQIEAELRRLVEQRFLTAQQAEAVSAERLYRIFAGPVGQRIAQADRVVREFKFSLLIDAALYDRNVQGEKLMLQGVTDCCLIRDGKLTVIDFKTDRVRPGAEREAAERYRGQLEAYSLALGRIFGLPVEEKLLYFFHTDTPVSLK